ncbi:ATP-binding protein [Rhodoplanes roseus]|uniref:histidine kinase n=1 Tax=Rhodoplanes roseus TaxID=29409 RepID=A0A327KW82_9BRAD|nr:ATP-binding protein [Rhodoplanes roseus]RAI43069.1 hypothetical protein CH341_16215 [Rhodoplanes roseus]
MHAPQPAQPDSAAGRTRPRTLSFHLFSFGLGIVLPALFFAVFIAVQYYASERSRLEDSLRSEARALATAIDREIVGVTTTLEALATAPALKRGDLATFYQQAQDVRAEQNFHISVRDLSGTALTATRLPFGGRLENNPVEVREIDRIAIQSDRRAVSDVFLGLVTGRPTVQIVVPATIESRREYVVGASIAPEFFQEVLQRARLQDGWLATAIDGRGVFVVRSHQHEEFVGKKAPPHLVNAAVRSAGLYEDRSPDGISSVVAYDTSQLTGWRVIVSAPVSIIDDALRRSVLVVVGLGALLAVLALALADVVRRRILKSVERLQTAAHSLRDGRIPPHIPTPIKEFDDVGSILVGAASDLRSRERERDLAEAALKRLNENLERRVEAAMKEQEHAEAQLRQLQKMEAVGQLTGGIAHDFNNLLTVVIGNLGMLRNRVAHLDDPRLIRNVEAALDGAGRAAQLTSRLLAFSRQSPLQPSVVNANRLITGMMDLLTRTLGETIQLETELSEHLWRIEVDPHLLESALLNLAVNARDSMPEGGRLRLCTANVSVSEALAQTFGKELQPGEYVSVAVSDAGHGMPPDVKARVFEPFYTTKPVGQGTGLGLAQVYGFVKQSGGHITIDSEVDCGTTVRLYFPRDDRAEGVVAEGPPRKGVPRVVADALILVVEDDPRVSEFTLSALKEAGYRVLAAPDGVAALQALQDHRGDIRLLFTDMVLSGAMNGRTLADEAVRLSPAIKVLFTTGYTQDKVLAERRREGSAQVLSKPFDGIQLLNAIAHALDGS